MSSVEVYVVATELGESVETGTYYNYFRTYDPSIGRYTQSDPIGLAGGLNTYTYAYDDPVDLTDPYGLEPATHGNCEGAGCRMNNQSGPRGLGLVGGVAGTLGPVTASADFTGDRTGTTSINLIPDLGGGLYGCIVDKEQDVCPDESSTFTDGPDEITVGLGHFGISVSRSRFCVNLGVSLPIPANVSENRGPTLQ